MVVNSIKYKELANSYFFKREYKSALFNFSLALKISPDDKEAKIGALLSDLAMESENEAVALFEYYEITKSLDGENADNTLLELIDSIDLEESAIVELLGNIESYIDSFEDGIEYKDFLVLIKERGSFKKVIEDIMFSTKIIIHKKEDFIDFIKLLIENNYRDLALNYIENALLHYPTELFFKINFANLSTSKY